MKKTKIFMGIPSTGNRVDEQIYALREIEKKYGDRVELIYPEKCVYRIFHDYARCAVVDEFLATDCDILWFLDSDIVPHSDVLSIVTDHQDKWELAGAPYPVFVVPSAQEFQQVVWCVYGRDGEKLFTTNVPTEGQQFVAGLATGCIFIKREVFAKLQKPYFEFKYNPETRCLIEGEDLGFCQKVNALGLEFFTDFALPCKHYKNVDLMAVCNYATIYARNSIKKYDEMIRPQVDQLASNYKKLLAEKRRAPPQTGVTRSGIILP